MAIQTRSSAGFQALTGDLLSPKRLPLLKNRTARLRRASVAYFARRTFQPYPGSGPNKTTRLLATLSLIRLDRGAALWRTPTVTANDTPLLTSMQGFRACIRYSRQQD